MKKCRVCGCTDNSPCFTDVHGERHTLESLAAFSDEVLGSVELTPCCWIELNLCSACVQPGTAPLLFGPDGKPLRGAP